MSNIIQFSGMFNKNRLPYLNQAQLAYAYFEVRPGTETAVANMRMPMNFSLALDRSGSMYGDNIRQLRGAVKSMIDQLHDDDYISIIAFNSKTEILAKASAARDKQKLHRQVDKLKASGGTNMEPAMEASLTEIGKYLGADKVSRLILLTDGQTNRESECHKRAAEAGQMGIPIIALGLGDGWNEDFLIDVASKSGQGGYADQIKRPEDADKIFSEVLSSMQVVAQNLTFRLLMVQGMEARRVWQVTPLIKDVSMGTIQGRTVVVDLPDLSESGAAFLVEMLIPPRNLGAYRFAQAEVLYDVPAQGLTFQKESINMMAEITADQYAAGQVNGRVMNIVEKVTAFKLQTQALDEAMAGNITSATRKLRAAHTRLLEQGELDLAQTALAEAERLERGQGISSKGKKTMKLQSRKTVKLSEMDLPSL